MQIPGEFSEDRLGNRRYKALSVYPGIDSSEKRGLISSQLRDTAENRSDRLKEDEIEAQGKTLYLAVNTVIFGLHSMKRDMNRQKSSEKNSTRTGTDMNFDSGTKKRSD